MAAGPEPAGRNQARRYAAERVQAARILRLGAAAKYSFQVQDSPLRAQINVVNITDQRIYDVDGGAILWPTPPLSGIAALSAEF